MDSTLYSLKTDQSIIIQNYCSCRNFAVVVHNRDIVDINLCCNAGLELGAINFGLITLMVSYTCAFEFAVVVNRQSIQCSSYSVLFSFVTSIVTGV